MVRGFVIHWLVLIAGCSTSATTRVESAWPAPELPPYLLHLPGIGGERRMDRRMVWGLVDAGFPGNVEIHNWVRQRPGITALTDRRRHDAEAALLAEKIITVRRISPRRNIILTGHSAGTGIIVFALEKLPPGVGVDRVVLLASALSPGYDLSKALWHVNDTMFSFSSEFDNTVLGVGTSLLGTMDGVKTPAAGCVGFQPPPGADSIQYQKLRQYPYRSDWMQWGNSGLHIGALNRVFARVVLAPLINGNPFTPPVAARRAIATQPAE